MKEDFENYSGEMDEELPLEDNPRSEDMTDQQMIMALSQLAERLVPKLLDYHRIKAPEIKHTHDHHFYIIGGILLMVSILSLYNVVDGTAAFAIYGAVIYYIFGSQKGNPAVDIFRLKT